MAEVQRMTVDEVVSYFLEGEGVDYLRESLTWMCQQLMEAEVSDPSRWSPGRTVGCRLPRWVREAPRAGCAGS